MVSMEDFYGIHSRHRESSRGGPTACAGARKRLPGRLGDGNCPPNRAHVALGRGRTS